MEQKQKSKNRIPITVRQLEAIIRLSESLAKMRLKSEVSTEDVDEAHYLFEVSTLKSVEGSEMGFDLPEDTKEEVQKLEEIIKKRIAIGNQVTYQKLM